MSNKDNATKLTTAIRLQAEEVISQIKEMQAKEDRYIEIMDMISYRYPEVYEEITEYLNKRMEMKDNMKFKKFWNFWMYQDKRVSPSDISEIPIEEHVNITYETVEVTEEEYKKLMGGKE